MNLEPKNDGHQENQSHEPRRVFDATNSVDLLPQVSQVDRDRDGLANTDYGQDIFRAVPPEDLLNNMHFDNDNSPLLTDEQMDFNKLDYLSSSAASQCQSMPLCIGNKSVPSTSPATQSEFLKSENYFRRKLPFKLRFKNLFTATESSENVEQCVSASGRRLKGGTPSFLNAKSSVNYDLLKLLDADSQSSTSGGMKSETNNTGNYSDNEGTLREEKKTESCSEEDDSDECKEVSRGRLHNYNLRENRNTSDKEPDEESKSSVEYLGATSRITTPSSIRRKRCPSSSRPKADYSTDEEQLPQQLSPNQETFQDKQQYIRAKDAFKRKEFEEFHGIIKGHRFQEKYHDDLQRMWYESHYLMEEKRRSSALGVVQRFIVRRKHPPPITISNGIEKKYHFNKKSRMALEHFFCYIKYPTSSEKLLAQEANLDEKQVTGWFKNMRKKC